MQIKRFISAKIVLVVVVVLNHPEAGHACSLIAVAGLRVNEEHLALLLRTDLQPLSLPPYSTPLTQQSSLSPKIPLMTCSPARFAAASLSPPARNYKTHRRSITLNVKPPVMFLHHLLLMCLRPQ